MSEVERGRTDQKLRFARLHLDELAEVPSGRGDDFERAHHEAVLAQLHGAYDAFLQELNITLGCGHRPDDVSLGKLRKSLKARNRSSAALRQLYLLQQDQASWLSQLRALRHASVHRRGVPLAFHLGGPKDRQVSFRHPTTLEELEDPAFATLSGWLDQMRTMIGQLRALAFEEGAG